MSATYLRCPADRSVSRLAAHFGVSDRDIWLPFAAYVAARDKGTSTVEVPDSTPIVLRDLATEELFLNRDDILMKLCLLDQRTARGLRLAPSEVPPTYVLYLRWDKATGTKRVAADTVVMHYVLTDAQALAGGAAVASAPGPLKAGSRKRSGDGADAGSSKRRRVVAGGKASSHRSHGSVDGSTLAETVRGGQEADALFARAGEDLERRLTDALASLRRRDEADPASAARAAAARQSSAIREYAINKILQCKELPPLHLLPRAVCSSSSLVLPSGVTWARPDARVLCRIFRPKSSTERSAASKYTDASRQVAFFFVDDVLLAGPTASEAETSADPSQDAAAEPSRSSKALERQSKARAAMAAYADRGYRIVLLDHYPGMHHGSTLSAEETLVPLARCIQEECDGGSVSITVVLSIMSYITAGQKRGISASFLLPNTGLLPFFTSELNSSLEVDTRASVVVGTRHRGRPFLDGIHATFAANAGIPFVEVDDIGPAP